MARYLFSLCLLFFSCFQLNAQQQLTEKASFSVVTCGPGSELYTAFGHSAFRVFDPALGLDKIYNYGTFDFNAPNFYGNFAKGNLTYFLSTSDFVHFLRVYQYENRWVKLQLLNLTNNEVQALYNYLEKNAKIENRNYQYDFFYDNCSTKIEAIITTVLKDKVKFPNNHITSHKSHRDLIYDYTKAFKWGKFGIDLALGAVIDNEASKDDYKFLPDYIFAAFEHATIEKGGIHEPLVKKEIVILKDKPVVKKVEILSPFNVLLLLSLFIIFITYKNHRQLKRSKWLDFTILFSTGTVGVIVLLLWFATTHTATYQNLNFLWAFAPNLLVAFFIFKNREWIKYYMLLLLILLVIMSVLWILKIQVFNNALIPLCVALGFRYLYLIKAR